MKVRVTIDVDRKDRLLIGTANDGELGTVATREQIVEYIETAYEVSIQPARAEFDKETKAIVAQIRDTMGLS